MTAMTVGSPSKATPEGFDVIRAEVFRKGLEAITEEMTVTLIRTSGSPVVTEGKDFSTSVLDVHAEQIGFSGYVAFHISTSFLGVAAVLRNYPMDDIRPGDGFLINDPHTAGAIHQGDAAIVMPYYYRDQFIGWGHIDEHVLDVGGSAVSGFAPDARDCFSEALRFPGVRVIRDGLIDPNWQLFLETNVRVPGPVINDLRSMVAAHYTGQERLSRLIDEFGIEEFQLYSEINKKLSEDMVRRKIARLPDGEYWSQDFVEYDGHGVAELYPLECRLVIDGDEAVLHFSGHPQVDAFINATPGVMLGQAMTTLLVQLIYDVPVNAGIWRPFTFDLGAPGSIVNARPPAPTTQGHMETGSRVNKLVSDVLSQAAGLSDDPVLRSRVAGQPGNGTPSTTLTGIDRRVGQPTIVFPMSPPHCLGGGAQSIHDGQDTYGQQCGLGNGVPAVEIEESTGPMMVLWRRIRPNSGGAGMFRGGQGSSMAMAIRGADEMRGPAFNSVAEAPARGVGGGMPAAASHYHVLRHTSLDRLLADGKLPTEARLEGEYSAVPSKVGSLTVEEGDVFFFTSNGGGGYGDPLLRDPEAVAWDARGGYVTADLARDVYGVILREDGSVDAEGTAARRRGMRIERTGQAEVCDASVFLEARDVGVGRAGEQWRCNYCGGDLGSIGGNYRDAAVLRESKLVEHFERFAMHARRRPAGSPPFVLREYFCPGCGYSVAADVTLAGSATVRAPKLATAPRGS
jgi:N-methylhydantoinase B